MGPIHVFIAHTHSTAQHEEKAQDCTGHSREAPSSFLYMCIKGLRAATKLWWTHWPSRVPFACRKVATAAKKNEKQREEFVFIFLACIYGHYSMPRSSHKSWKCIFTTVPVRERNMASAACPEQQQQQQQPQGSTWKLWPAAMFPLLSLSLFISPPSAWAWHILNMPLHLFIHQFSVCVRVFAGLIVAHAAYAQRT